MMIIPCKSCGWTVQLTNNYGICSKCGAGNAEEGNPIKINPLIYTQKQCETRIDYKVRKEVARVANEIATIFMGKEWKKECHCCEDYICAACIIKRNYLRE